MRTAISVSWSLSVQNRRIAQSARCFYLRAANQNYSDIYSSEDLKGFSSVTR